MSRVVGGNGEDYYIYDCPVKASGGTECRLCGFGVFEGEFYAAVSHEHWQPIEWRVLIANLAQGGALGASARLARVDLAREIRKLSDYDLSDLPPDDANRTNNKRLHEANLRVFWACTKVMSS